MTKYQVVVGWAVTKYQVVGLAVTKYRVVVGWAVTNIKLGLVGL